MVPRETFTILIDGDCPLCRREAALLARLDRGRGGLRLVDIAAPGFDPGPLGRTRDDLMGEIHGLDADGRLVTGMEVFRGAYAAVGAGWLLAPTAWWPLRPLLDAAYRWFARHRLRLTGRAAGCAGACRPAAAD
ncbi:MAG: thiol-disulfide oxidoreductase DCC family protein [Planctomycetota bacterium]|jgi:predicted DCC family thiol-disulfide oxidoreductase YuxK